MSRKDVDDGRLTPDADGRRIASGIVFRSGQNNPTNMTPRVQDMQGPRRGLSAHIESQGALPSRREGAKTAKYKLQMIDIAAFVTLEVYQGDTGHVSIRPPTQGELEEWIEARGRAEVHPRTQEVMDAVIGRQVVER